MARGARSRVKVGLTKVWVSIALMVLAPLMVFAAVLLVGSGVVSLDFGLDVLTLRIALWTSFVALAVALGSFVLSLGQFRRLGAATLAVLLVCAGICGLFVWQARAIAVEGPSDVSTNLGDPPPIPGATGPVATCDGVAALPRQVALEAASYVLVEEGFAITDVQRFSVRGVKEGFWFGLDQQAVIRIRPGQTDVRVVALHKRPDGGATCRLAAALMAGLQPDR
jgi:hypothetical protein